MSVQDVMTSDVQRCGPDTNLAAVAKMMWDIDCGVLPVLNGADIRTLTLFLKSD